MVNVREGDVIRYRQGNELTHMIGVVVRQVSPRTIELCDGAWIDATAVRAVLRNAKQMPSPSALAAASLSGDIAK